MVIIPNKDYVWFYCYLRPKETQTSSKTLWILLKPRPTVATSACDCAKEMVCKVMKLHEFLPCRVSVSPYLQMRVSPCSCWVMFASFPGDHPHSASWKQSLRCNQVGVADRKLAHLGKIPDPPNLLNWRPVAMAFGTSWKASFKPRSKLVEPPLPALDLDSHCRQDIVLARPLDGIATMRG